MPLAVPVAHDFVCEWCWLGLFQGRRMRREFGVELDWRPYVLFPDDLEEEYKPGGPPPPPNKPRTPSRQTLAFAAEGLEFERKPYYDSHSAHEAVEFAKLSGVHETLIERLYFAHWTENANVSEIAVIRECAKGLGLDLAELEASVQGLRFSANIVHFNDAAHANGVYNLPTYWIGGERYAEQPWIRLRKALAAWAESETEWPHIYGALAYPINLSKPGLPYVFVNMVATIDGKILSGKRGEPVEDLGSPNDHKLMRRIEDSSEAVLIGAGSQRSTSKLHYSCDLWRFVVTHSGNILAESRFFADCPTKAVVVCGSEAALPTLADGVQIWRSDVPHVNLREALRRMRSELGIRRVLVEGGSDLNGQLFRDDLIDEIFLTVAPKIKLGENVPTIATAPPFDRSALLQYALVEKHAIGDEVFLRYRRRG